LKIAAKRVAITQNKAAISTEDGPSPENRSRLNEPTATQGRTKGQPPIAEPHLQPQMNSPATAVAMRSGVDGGLSAVADCKITTDGEQIWACARIDAIVAAAHTDRQIQLCAIQEQLAHRQASLWPDNHLPLSRSEVAGNDAGAELDSKGRDSGCGQFDQDSDVQCRALNKVIQLGLDPRDPFVQHVLQEGPPLKRGQGMNSEDSEVDELDASSNGDNVSDNTDDNPEDDDGSDISGDLGAPVPDINGHIYEYNYNTWSRYFGAAPSPGIQSAVERLSWYCRDDDEPWLEIPNGTKIPRVNSYQDEEAAQHKLTNARLGIPARRELPVFNKQPEAQHVAKINL